MKQLTILLISSLVLAGSSFAGGGPDCANPVALATPGAQLVPAYDTSGAGATTTFNSCHAVNGTGFPNAEYYSWVADATGVWQFSTCNIANYDTLLGFYDNACGTQLACNDDGGGCAGFSSSMSAGGIVNGNTYIIQLGGFTAATGSSSLDITFLGGPPANDDCANAIALPPGPSSTMVDSTNSTNDGAQPSCGGAFASPNDVWYEWTPSFNGDWMFSTSLSGFPTRIAIRDGCMGTELACDSPNGDALVTLNGAQIGTTYYLQVCGNDTETGTTTLDITPLGGNIGNNYCMTAANSAGSGALITGIGSASVGANDLSLVAGAIAPGQPGVFYYGPSALTGLAFGNGFRCVGGPAGTVVRIFPFVVSNSLGSLSTSLDNTNPVHAQIIPGATLNFQAWFRDPAAGGTGFNLSDGYTILFGI
jgi:hypothetical protein